MSGPDRSYDARLRDEGEHWQNFTLSLLKQGILPYCCDFRLHLMQLLASRHGLPFHLGAGLLPTRFREVRNVLGGAAAHVRAGHPRVLDLGSGGGWLSLELARQGADVLGLDVSPDNLRMARFFAAREPESRPFLYPQFAGLPLQKFGAAHFELADLNSPLPQLRDGSFDLVTVWDSLHHVRDLGVTFTEVGRLLAPEGFFIGHDYVGPSPEATAVNDLLQETVRQVYRTLSAPELLALRRHMVALAACLPLEENAVDAVTEVPAGAAAYIERTLSDLGRELDLERRDITAVPSPFEEVSVAYLLTELERAFDVRAFYTMGVYWPESMPPPAADPDDGGGLFFHYLSYLMLIADDLLVDAGLASGRYVCFVAVPRGHRSATPAFSRSAAPWLRRLSEGQEASAREPEREARLRLLEAENRILRRIVSAPPGPAADASRFYFKMVRPFLLALTSRLRGTKRYRGM